MALYEERDLEQLGDHYLRHVAALTEEKLHDKSDIAAELAWRDQLIDTLQNSTDASAGAALRLFGLLAAKGVLRRMSVESDNVTVWYNDRGTLVPCSWTINSEAPLDQALTQCINLALRLATGPRVLNEAVDDDR